MAGNPNAKIRTANEGLTLRHGNGQLDWTGVVRTIPERFHQPLSWRTPRRVFVNSLSDLFHEGVHEHTLLYLFGVMALAGRHTFQILTKRPERMRAYLATPNLEMEVWIKARNIAFLHGMPAAAWPDPWNARLPWPLPNVWLGVSVEDQQRADERVPFLLDTTAAVKFLSCEPLLGAINLSRIRWPGPAGHAGRLVGALSDAQETDDWLYWIKRDNGVRWVIAGGESGPGYRPMDLAWARSLQEQCAMAGAAFWFKQDASQRPGARPDALGQIYQEFPDAR